MCFLEAKKIGLANHSEHNPTMATTEAKAPVAIVGLCDCNAGQSLGKSRNYSRTAEYFTSLL